MIRAECIRQKDIAQMADYLCYLTDSHCRECFFRKGEEVRLDEECAAIKYLKEEVPGDDLGR